MMRLSFALLLTLAIFGLGITLTACDRPPDTPGAISQAGGNPCTNTTCGNQTCITPGHCYPDYCFDQIQDRDETGKDCGGSCPSCAAGASCRNPGDCRSNVCQGEVCQPVQFGVEEPCPNTCSKYRRCPPGYVIKLDFTSNHAVYGCVPVPDDPPMPGECFDFQTWNLQCPVRQGGTCYAQDECSPSLAMALGWPDGARCMPTTEIPNHLDTPRHWPDYYKKGSCTYECGPLEPQPPSEADCEGRFFN